MSKELIIISGSPGTGKSTLARSLAKKLGFQRLNLHNHYREISKIYDPKKQSHIIDYNKFEKLVREKKKRAAKGLIVDSHISHLLPKKMVDLGVVLTCSDLKTLETRLKKRKYSRKKIRENLDAEIFQVCLAEAKERKHRILVFDTGKRADADKIAAIVKSMLDLKKKNSSKGR